MKSSDASHNSFTFPVYTKFGYGMVKEELSTNQEANTQKINNDSINNLLFSKVEEEIQVKLKDNSIAFIQKCYVKNIIFINIKTFFENKKNFKICCNINDKLESIVQNISKQFNNEDILKYTNYRIIFCRGKIVDAPLKSTFFDLNIAEDSTLIFLIQSPFTWDPFHKGYDIILSNNQRTATKNRNDYFQTIIGKIGFSHGRNFWEISIDSFDELDDILIGISTRDLPVNQLPGHLSLFWGYLCPEGKKIFPSKQEDNLVEYGEGSKVGDVIGCVLEYGEKSCTLEFFRNNISMGIAFSDIPLKTYYSTVSLHYPGSQITLIDSQNNSSQIEESKDCNW